MEDDELLEREKKRTKYLDFSKCVICQKSNGKKTGNEPFEAIATFRAICSKFFGKT